MSMNTHSSWAIEVQTDKGIRQVNIPHESINDVFTTFDRFVAGLSHIGWQEVSRRRDGTLVMMIRRGAMNSLRLVEIPHVVKTTHFSPALLAFGVTSVRLQGE